MRTLPQHLNEKFSGTEPPLYEQVLRANARYIGSEQAATRAKLVLAGLVLGLIPVIVSWYNKLGGALAAGILFGLIGGWTAWKSYRADTYRSEAVRANAPTVGYGVREIEPSDSVGG